MTQDGYTHKDKDGDAFTTTFDAETQSFVLKAKSARRSHTLDLRLNALDVRDFFHRVYHDQHSGVCESEAGGAYAYSPVDVTIVFVDLVDGSKNVAVYFNINDFNTWLQAVRKLLP